MVPSLEDQVLAVHLGGLGDVCLSESTFLSLTRHFGQKLTAVGNERFLSLFADHFSSIHSVEGREWLYLFTDDREGFQWRRIVLIGKDRSGDLRTRLDKLSREPLLFVDMYPESQRVHVEGYQLGQLEALGIEPTKKPLQPRPGEGLILYPEKGYRKQKWPYEKFLEVYSRLRPKNRPVSLLEPFDTEHPHPESFRFDQLSEVKSFLVKAGFFISNDCGIAHLAGSCGLATITLFSEADPTIWRPVGDNLALPCTSSSPSVEQVIAVIKTVNGKR